MPSFKLLIFDCDGVLFDSKEANVYFYNHILKQLNLPPLTSEEIEYIHMHTVDECIKFLLNKRAPEKLELAKKIQKETPFSLFFAYMKLEPGLKEFLEWAKNYFYLAICTNRTTSIQPLLEHFDLKKYFHFIMSALKRPKTDPHALLDILYFFKIKPEEALYIGDSQIDEKLCKVCKVKLVAFKNPNLSADFYINDYEELKKLLTKNF